jgi:ribosomal protein L37AE/L43A
MKMKGQVNLERIPKDKDVKCEFCGKKAVYRVKTGDKNTAVCDKCVADL